MFTLWGVEVMGGQVRQDERGTRGQAVLVAAVQALQEDAAVGRSQRGFIVH